MVEQSVIGLYYNERSHLRGECSIWANPTPWSGGDEECVCTSPEAVETLCARQQRWIPWAPPLPAGGVVASKPARCADGKTKESRKSLAHFHYIRGFARGGNV